jgi:hypothetical protein
VPRNPGLDDFNAFGVVSRVITEEVQNPKSGDENEPPRRQDAKSEGLNISGATRKPSADE